MWESAVNVIGDFELYRGYALYLDPRGGDSIAGQRRHFGGPAVRERSSR